MISKLQKQHLSGVLIALFVFVFIASPMGDMVRAGSVPAVSVNVRVEGAAAGIFDGTVLVESPGGETQTALDALVCALDGAGIDYVITDTDWGPYLFSIDGEESGSFGGWDGWMFVVNNEIAPVGAGDYHVQNGDKLVFYYGLFPPGTLIPTVELNPLAPETGEEITVTVSSVYFDWNKGEDITVLIENATVSFEGDEYFTDSNGRAVLPPVNVPGTYFIRASKDVEGDCPELVRTGNIEFVVGGDLIIDKSALLEAIEQAEDLLGEAVTGEQIGQYPPAAVNSLNQTLSAARDVFLDEEAAQSDVDSATESLSKAISAFRVSVIREEAPELSAALESVLDYYRSKTGLTSWWELVAIRGAGSDPRSGDWNLPEWTGDDLPAGSPATGYAGFVLGLMAMGDDPSRAWDGRNLVRELAEKQMEDGSFGDGINGTIWSIIALKACGGSFSEEAAAAYLLSLQLEDGGFTLSSSTGDPDMTGMALVALSGYRHVNGVAEAIESALDFLENAQLDSAGFASWGNENANSIAAVISGLISVGENIFSERWVKNPTILDALLGYQVPDGSFSFLLDPLRSNEMATVQAFIALGDLAAGEPAYYRLMDSDGGGVGELPRTGSVASYWFYAAGAILVLAGAAFVIITRLRK